MNVENAIRLYLRIYQNNYLHLNKVKYNQNLQDWHYVNKGDCQFYLVHTSLETRQYRNWLLLPLISQLNIQNDETEEYFWNIFTAFDRMFYICGGMIDGKFTTMDNRARLFVALVNNNNDEKLRLSLIKKLLANCFIDFYTANYLTFSKSTLYFRIDNENKISLRHFVQAWQSSHLSALDDIKALKILQDYYLSLIDYLENGLNNSFLKTYQLPSYIAPQGKRIKLEKIDLMDIYPNLS